MGRRRRNLRSYQHCKFLLGRFHIHNLLNLDRLGSSLYHILIGKLIFYLVMMKTLNKSRMDWDSHKHANLKYYLVFHDRRFSQIIWQIFTQVRAKKNRQKFPPVRIEPRTSGSSCQCSTTWAKSLFCCLWESLRPLKSHAPLIPENIQHVKWCMKQRNLLLNTYLPSTDSRVLEWWSRGPAFNPNWGQFLVIFFFFLLFPV